MKRTKSTQKERGGGGGGGASILTKSKGAMWEITQLDDRLTQSELHHKTQYTSQYKNS